MSLPAKFMHTAWFLCGTPDGVRKYVPDFNRPVNNGPFLVFLMDGGGSLVLERPALLEIMHHLLTTLDAVVGNMQFIGDPNDR